MRNKPKNQRRSVHDLVIEMFGRQTDRDYSNWTANTSLEELDIDSFEIIEFFFVLEDTFDVALDYGHSVKNGRWKTIGDVITIVEQQLHAKEMAADAVTIAA